MHVLRHSLHLRDLSLGLKLQIVDEMRSLTCHDHEPSLGMGRKQDRSAVPRARSPPALRHSVDASASLCASSTDTRGLRPHSSAAEYRSVKGACMA